MEKTPSLQFRIDPRDFAPPYRQLVQQVREAIADGRLVAGDQLPSVRDVVGQITINPNTVHRAYRELEHLGLCVARSGLGTFVSDAVSSSPSSPASGVLATDIASAVRRALASGLSAAEVRAVIATSLELTHEVRP